MRGDQDQYLPLQLRCTYTNIGIGKINDQIRLFYRPLLSGEKRENRWREGELALQQLGSGQISSASSVMTKKPNYPTMKRLLLSCKELDEKIDTTPIFAQQSYSQATVSLV